LGALKIASPAVPTTYPPSLQSHSPVFMNLSYVSR
jgi:hypothetical protein